MSEKMADNGRCAEIRAAVRERYLEVARGAEGHFRYPTGKAGAEALGYNTYMIRAAPEEMIGSFCGVGNPFSLGFYFPAATVLDIGCGAGFDVFCASYAVGPAGRVFGVDLTPAMVEMAWRSLKQAGRDNVELRVTGMEDLPFEEDFFDAVISNGVLNLSPEKDRVLAEVFRVLKPGGWFLFADMVRKEPGKAAAASAREWSD